MAHTSNMPAEVKAFSFIMLVWIACIVAQMLFVHVTLYPDRIETHTWRGKKVMLRTDVRELSLYGKFKIPHLVSDTGSYFTLPTGIREDEAWKMWMDAALSGSKEGLNDKVFAKPAYSNTPKTLSLWQRFFVSFDLLAILFGSLTVFVIILLLVATLSVVGIGNISYYYGSPSAANPFYHTRYNSL
jgi:hypothetical protein